MTRRSCLDVGNNMGLGQANITFTDHHQRWSSFSGSTQLVMVGVGPSFFFSITRLIIHVAHFYLLHVDGLKKVSGLRIVRPTNLHAWRKVQKDLPRVTKVIDDDGDYNLVPMITSWFFPRQSSFLGWPLPWVAFVMGLIFILI